MFKPGTFKKLANLSIGFKNSYIHRMPTRCVSYVQGQYRENNIREYFYYIDHHGQLFLDDSRMKNFTSCFKDKEFLAFFFKRLRFNETGVYTEFPYLSRCGRERNYIRCDDKPIVFTHVIESDKDLFSYGGAGDKLVETFDPEKLCMLSETGRIYHPAPEIYGGIGLVRSSLAIEFSKLFEFEDISEYDPPTHFNWRGNRYKLTNQLFSKVEKDSS